MFNQVTYNVLIERFKAFAAGHYKIERFSHGQIDVTDIEKEQRFPWMHVVPVSIAPSSGSRSFTLDVVFADMPRDKENKTEYQRESLSDCIQLAEDLLAEIKNGSVIFGEDVTLEEGSAVQPFMEEYTHVLTGVTLSLTMTFPWNWNACDIPADWTTGGSSSGGGGGVVPALVLKVNDVDNVIQNILNLVDGTNTTVVDLGDGRVQINSTGGTEKIYWGEILGNIADQLDLALWFNDKADISSLAEVAFTGDYNDLLNIPTPTTPTFQETLVAGSTLNQDNTVDGGDFDLTFDNVNDFFVNGNYRGDIGSVTAPTKQNLSWGNDFVKLETQDQTTGNFSHVQVTTGNAVMVSQDATKYTQIVTEPNALKLSTPNMLNGGAQNGMVLTLVDNNNGKVEFANVNTGTEWGDITGTLSDQTDLQNALDAKMSVAVYDTDVDGVVDAAERIEIIVRNSTGATLQKGRIVYLSGATGNRPNAILADASTEATSSKTIGFVVEDIANNADGNVAVNGTLHDLDTSAFSAGDTLWLSETAGAWQANTPPAEPAHAVFLGYVARSHPTLGRVVIQIQNGYELNELHGVQITSPADKDALMYESATGLWKNKQIVSADISNATDVGRNLLSLTNPTAIRYLRVNADNSIAALSLTQLKAELGLSRTVLASSVSTSAVSTALVDVTGLTFPIIAGNTYKFTAYLIHTVSVNNVGLKWAVNADVAVSNIVYRTFQNAGVPTAMYIHQANTLNSASTNTGSTSSNQINSIEGILVANNTGTAIIRFGKSQANAGTLTVQAGSFVEYQII